jgi:hypothetical protein
MAEIPLKRPQNRLLTLLRANSDFAPGKLPVCSGQSLGLPGGNFSAVWGDFIMSLFFVFLLNVFLPSYLGLFGALNGL